MNDWLPYAGGAALVTPVLFYARRRWINRCRFHVLYNDGCVSGAMPKWMAEEVVKVFGGRVVKAAKVREMDRKIAETEEWLDSLGPVPPGPTQEEIIDDMYDERGLPR